MHVRGASPEPLSLFDRPLYLTDGNRILECKSHLYSIRQCVAPLLLYIEPLCDLANDQQHTAITDPQQSRLLLEVELWLLK